MRARTPVAVAVLALLLAGAGLRAFEYGSGEAGVDFYQFWWVARSLGRGAVAEPARLYTSEVAAALGAAGVEAAARDVGSPRRARAAAWFRVLQPVGTPFFYTALRPLGALPYEAAQRSFLVVSLLAAAGSLLWLGRRLGLGWVNLLALTLAAFVGFEPMASELRVANVNRLLLAALVGHLALLLASARAMHRGQRRRSAGLELGAGVCAGLLVAFKPVLAPVFAGVGLWMVARRRWRSVGLAALGGALGLGLAAVVAALAFGSFAVWGAWAASWDVLVPGHTVSVAYGNYALARWLGEVVGAPVPWSLVLGLGCALLGGALVLRGLRQGVPAAPPLDAREGALALAFGFFVLAATAGLVWLHYELLALPGLLALAPVVSRGTAPDDALHDALVPTRGALGAWLLALACVALEPLRVALGLTSAPTYAAVVIAGNLLLGALAVGALWRRLGAAPGAAGRGAPVVQAAPGVSPR